MTEPRAIVASTGGEAPFLLEWVTYHRMIGFDTVVLFTHGPDDGTAPLCDAMQAAGLVHHVPNAHLMKGLPDDPQARAFRRAWGMAEVTGAEWVLVADTSEFFAVHAGEGRLDDLFTAAGPAELISATWRVFGNGGEGVFDDRLVTQAFTRAAPLSPPPSPRHYALRTLFRPSVAQRPGVHRPILLPDLIAAETPPRWLNGSGKEVTEHFLEKGWAATEATVGYDLCQMNRYAIRDSQSFILRMMDKAGEDGPDPSDFDAFNSNEAEDTSLKRWVGPLRREIRAIRKAHKPVARAHDAAVALHRDRIADAIAELAEEDAALAKRILAAPLPPADQDDIEDDGLTEPVGPEDAAPQWLADLRRSDHRSGFYQSDRNFAAHFAARDPKQLIISFDNLSNVKDTALSRESWGYSFYRSEGWSHMGVMSFAKNWYRDEALFNFMENLARSGFFKRFKRVALTGTSMGGYAATAFARLIPGCTVLAFSPQYTLDEAKVPWEERFKSGRSQDWSGRYRDATEELDKAGRVYVLYDPLFEPDRLHGQQYQGANITHLKAWYANHKSALFLRRANLLKPIVQMAVRGELDEAAFYRMYRARRALPWYVNGLVDHAMDRGHGDLVKRAGAALVRDGRGFLGNSVQARVSGTGSVS